MNEIRAFFFLWKYVIWQTWCMSLIDNVCKRGLSTFYLCRHYQSILTFANIGHVGRYSSTVQSIGAYLFNVKSTCVGYVRRDRRNKEHAAYHCAKRVDGLWSYYFIRKNISKILFFIRSKLRRMSFGNTIFAQMFIVVQAARRRFINADTITWIKYNFWR